MPRFRVWGNESLYRRAPRFIRGRRFATFGEAKRHEKFFLGLRVFWARKHRRQKGRFTDLWRAEGHEPGKGGGSRWEGKLEKKGMG